MSFDDQIRQALDRATAGLRAHLDAELKAFAEQMGRAAHDERTRAAHHAAETAAAEVRRQAEAQITQLREAAQRQAEEIKRAAGEQVGELRKSLQAQLDEVRRTAQAQHEQHKRASQEELEETRRVAKDELDRTQAAAKHDVEQARRKSEREVEDARRLAETQVEDVQRQMNDLLDETRQRYEGQLDEMRHGYEGQLAETRHKARAEMDALRGEMEATRRSTQAEAEEVVIGQLASAQADAARKIEDAIERTRTDAYQADLSHAARIVEAIRTLDDARALGEVLDALAECAGREVDRAAVLVVKGEGLRGWRFAGFPDVGPAKNVEMTLDDAGVAGAVVRTGVAVSRPTVGPGEEQGTRQPALPPFAQQAGTRHAMALPIVVGGRVVAVLYADAPRSDTPSAASRWPAVLEILVRHASRALEAMTVQQATGISLPRPVARASHGSLPGPVEHAGTGDEDAARRYARWLVSEIRLYHEPLVDAGRRSRDLRTRLRGEIDRARRLYEARVPSEVREKSDYFEQELVRTLADGDRTLLG